MTLRAATPADIPFIMQTERLPGYEETVGRWDAETHAREIATPSNRYFVFEEDGAPAAFAILQTIDDAEGNVYLKRIAVAQQGRGIGARAIGALQDWVFGALPTAHRLHLNYAARNARGHRLYAAAGFVSEGCDREAFVWGDGARVNRMRVSILRREWAAIRAGRTSRAPLIMGIVNVTPDSFSDGGRYALADAAIAHGLRLLEDGADIVDVGGESTRPGAGAVDAAEELRRVLPVIAALARAGARVSIDTMKPQVARAAVGEGAALWNDVSGFRTPDAVGEAARLGCGVIAMHMQGEPRTMQADPAYVDVAAEVGDFLAGRAAALAAAGVKEIWVDPGIGFGKTLAHNLALLEAVPELRRRTGRPVAIGASRKSFIGKIETRAGAAASPESARIGGSLAAALHAARAGADMIRVHDVAETVQALRVARALGSW